MISTDWNGKCGCWQWDGWDIKRGTKKTNPEDVDTSDTGTPNAQIDSSGDSANLLEAITLLQKALAVHGAGGSGQADTTDISSKVDRNKGSTYNEYFIRFRKMWRKRASSKWKYCKTFTEPCIKWHKRRKTWKSWKGSIASSNINGLEANKVNCEIWRQKTH